MMFSTKTQNEIHRIYEQSISENQKVTEQMRKFYPEVRILVVGRSGSGKTTLIRVLIGDSGPRSISQGQSGEQNIMTEWRHPDPELPLIIHDSNGIDSNGNARIADIQKFLDDRLSHLSTAGKKFGEQVHVIWYVFSAMDERVLDDGGLLDMLDSYGMTLPLVLIMTNNDLVEKLGPDDVKVTPMVLDQLLEKIKNTEKRDKLRESMVRVGNKIKLNQSTGEMMEGSRKDMDGMKLGVLRTKELLMDKKRWTTLIAGQVVDMDEKVILSSKIIVKMCRKHALAAFLTAPVPFCGGLVLAPTMFAIVTSVLIKAWNVPENMKKAIFKELLVRECGKAIISNMVTNLTGIVFVVGPLMATFLTGGVASSSLILAPTTGLPMILSTIRSMPTLLLSYGLLVLGFIFYVKAQELPLVTNNIQKSYEDYCCLCNQFQTSTLAKEMIRTFTEHYTSLWDRIFKEKVQRMDLQSHIVSLFKEIMLNKDKYHFTKMAQESNDEATFEQQASQVVDLPIDIVTTLHDGELISQ